MEDEGQNKREVNTMEKEKQAVRYRGEQEVQMKNLYEKGGTHEENISSGNSGGTLNPGIGDRLHRN
jgi:hypothetical protein